MDEVLPYQIWLKLPTEMREKLALLFHIPKTGSVNVETRATPDGSSYGSVVTRDGYNPDDLRAITVEKMQDKLITDETDFFALIETAIENIDALLDNSYAPAVHVNGKVEHKVEQVRTKRKTKARSTKKK